jgi:TPR repeat protein
MRNGLIGLVSALVLANLPTSADASAPAGRYVVTSGGTGNGTVYDTKSELTWQQTVSSTTYTWADAKTYCGSAAVSSSLGGTGWRLPTIAELESIVDRSQATAPRIDPSDFPLTTSDYFWSASPVAGSPSLAWIVHFYNGGTYSIDVSYATLNVRCVSSAIHKYHHIHTEAPESLDDPPTRSGPSPLSTGQSAQKTPTDPANNLRSIGHGKVRVIGFKEFDEGLICEGAWRRARKADTVEAYEQYIVNYPEAEKYIRLAKSRLEEKARKTAALFKKACDGGDLAACANLGVCYRDGTGMPKDLARASALFKQACDGGDLAACTHLGVCHRDGIGMPKDLPRAAALFKQACDGGDLRGCGNLAVAYANGDGVTEDRVRAAALFEQACSGGHADGCVALGVAHAGGDGVPKDLARAAKLFKQGCDGGSAKGCNNLAMFYDTGVAVPKDETRAAALYKKACDGGAAPSCFNLGVCHRDGIGMPKDLPRAAALFKKACDSGHARGCFNLGSCYELGEGLPKDLAQAAARYQQACDGGAAEGCHNLGVAFYRGDGVSKDLARAAALFKKACDGGYAKGCQTLETLKASP